MRCQNLFPYSETSALSLPLCVGAVAHVACRADFMTATADTPGGPVSLEETRQRVMKVLLRRHFSFSSVAQVHKMLLGEFGLLFHSALSRMQPFQ
jgi:hypothetical protein